MSKFFAIAGTMVLAATPAWAEIQQVPEMDGGYALIAVAIAMSVAALIHEKFFSR